ncbi:MAG: hypothetical protein K2K39_03935 [Clostridia bacterium]|nr:hypothetical protein [Clostridia bacterium]
MTKKIKVLLLTIFAGLCLSCGLAGCVGEPGLGEITAGYDDYIIEYYANGGLFGSSTTINVRSIYIKGKSGTDTVPFYDTNNSESDDKSNMRVSRSGFEFVGWYLPEVDPEDENEFHYTYTYEEDGHSQTVDVYKVKDEKGEVLTDSVFDRPVFARKGVEEQIPESSVQVVASETEVTEKDVVKKNEKLTVCAVWRPALKIIYKLVCEEGKKYQCTENGVTHTYTNGSILDYDDFGSGVTGQPTDMAPKTLEGATFVATYTKPDLKEIVGLIERPDEEDYDPEIYDPENKYVFVYCRYLDGGDWTVIKNDATAIQNMFGKLGSGSKYFLLNDVDCSHVTLNLKMGMNPSEAIIQSDGVTLKNLNFTRSGIITNNSQAFSIFGTVEDEFSISNVTFENVTITARANTSFTFFVLSSSIKAGAQFNNFAITGTIEANLSIPNGHEIYNAQGDNRDSWVFGRDANSLLVNDADYLAANQGKISVTDDRTLTITKS